MPKHAHTLKLYNTKSKKLEVFVPRDESRVTFYYCGPTVYNYIHIGNGRSAVNFDVLARLLKYLYGDKQVIFARNITDVDDKIIKAAREENVGIDVITQKYSTAFNDDIQALQCLVPDFSPTATAHIPQMISMIEQLIAKGHAYAAEGHVVFDVPTFKQYGELSGRTLDDQIAGARVEVAPYKKNPQDFVLWKPAATDEPGWDSPWGRGRPGWHIECSAMIHTRLGTPIDIHAGGIDLVFPHHENETAQSCCAHNTPVLAKYWVHNGFVEVEGVKMSKSVGNFKFARDILAHHHGEVVRLALITAQYRQPMNISDELMQQCHATLNRFYGALRPYAAPATLALHDDDVAPLMDDVNTPAMLAHMHELCTQLNTEKVDSVKQVLAERLWSCGRLMGLLQHDATAWLQQSSDQAAVDATWVEQKIAERKQARATKDFAKADAVRAELLAAGIELEDGASGTTWRRIIR